ncbi:MAG: hypothetical protein ABI810_05425 [Sphingomonas bacterium]
MTRTSGALIVISAIALVWGSLLFSSTNQPELLPALSGCYAAPGQPRISIAPRGILHFGREEVTVTAYRDKVGVALLPVKGVYVDSQDHDRLELDSSVLLIRFSDDRQSFVVPDYRQGAGIRFVRTVCS